MKKLSLFAAMTLCLFTYNATAQTLTAPPSAGAPPSAPLQPPQMMQPPPATAYAPPPVVVQPSYCQPYTDSFTIGAEMRITRGTACLHPDGSWELHPVQAGVNYITRGGVIYMVPSQPFASVIIEAPHHRRRDW